MLKKHYKADKESFVLIINNHHTNWMKDDEDGLYLGG